MSWREMLKRQWIWEVSTPTPWRRDCRSDKDLEVSTGTFILAIIVTRLIFVECVW